MLEAQPQVTFIEGRLPYPRYEAATLLKLSLLKL